MSVRHVALFTAFILLAPFVFADHNVNINTADQTTLETLTGIGPSKAQAIIDYRTQNGPFATIEEIQNVSGIGPATYGSIKDHITVSGGNSTAPPPSPSPAPSPSPSPSSGKTSSPSPSPSSAATSGSGLSVDAGSDRIVITGADVQFSARAYRDKKVVDNSKFTWNFGDGSTARGESVVHRFDYAGEYAVIVTASHDDDRATDRFTVTAEEAELALRALADGSVEIENLSKRDADLSGWLLESSEQRFTLPADTVLLAEQTIRISPNTLRFSAGSGTALYYPSGALAFAAGESVAQSSSSPAVSPVPVEVSPEIAKPRPAKTKSNKASKAVPDIEDSEPTVAATSSQVAAAAGSAPGSWTWWLAAGGLSLGAAAAVFVARRFGRKEWTIEDESGSV